jgi:hypothetical protein
MPRRVDVEDDWNDDGFDPPEGVYGDEEDDTVPCPYCKRPIPEDTPRCPYCENYLSEEDHPAEGKPLWILVGFLLCLFVVALWVLGG